MKSKGALIWDYAQPWSVEEIEIGDPQQGEVKVRVETAGLCQFDQRLASGDVPTAEFPILGGHEGAGVIVEVGTGVDQLAVGDHVVFSFIPACGICQSCLSGHHNLCDRGQELLTRGAVSDGTFRIRARGHDVHPTSLIGAFAPYAVVHKSSVVKIDPTIPFDIACLASCSVTTGYGAVVNTATVRPGEDIAVIGAGAVGTAAVQAAVISGARRIFAVDPVEAKCTQAAKFGATHTYSDIDTAIGAIEEITGGQMCRTVIVAVGRCDGHDLAKWMRITAKAGSCVLAATGDAAETNPRMNLSALTFQQKSLCGTLFGGGNPQLLIPEVLALYKLGDLGLGDMITREYPLEQINAGITDMLEGRNIRGIIRFTDADR
ncbi:MULTISPECIES: NDMA-dependent alcohol dehydrogenase [Nocardia]|uniref:NDMA-dependent alcohol dehydrogenase n=1 Tax=Nocardia TaxID=1817 RepID=UPI001893DB1A|nr:MULTISPECIES: NDMA-dependent alcohol dehydrogenase [Nocardia]MBF6347746.1 NDMA-dependent alcohol dehydrogenase [Nocardia flavorosea]